MSRSSTGSRFLLKFIVLTLLAVAVLLAPSTLRADTVTYILDPGDTLASGGSISGTFTENLSTQQVAGTIVADGLTFTCSICAIISPSGVLTDMGFIAPGPGTAFVVLGWSKLPVNAHQITFNPTTSYCNGCVTGALDFLSAGDTATNVPEPSTLLLLMSGLAAVPFMRRRCVNS